MNAVQVRPATAADVPGIAAVGTRAFRAAYGPSTRPEDAAVHLERYFSAAAVRRALATAGCRYLVAEADATIAGFALLRAGAPPADVPADNALEVGQLYVAPERQRLGAGRALIEAAAALASAEAAEGIWLTTWEDADWAIAFYTGIGFRRVGSADFPVGAPHYRDALLWLPVARTGAGPAPGA
ncbi:MAG: GNAT family N-acetyltransferase [Woeseiaceae bacterium]|nr:GNAT family N-acetyltransferase [Woeseiaceae bacterium]